MKRRRADDLQESVVKCCLKKYLLQPELLPIIQRWVAHVSKISHRGSLLLNHYLLWCMEHNHPLPDLEDQTLYQQCFTMGACTTRKEVANLLEFYEQVKHLYPPPSERLTGDTQAILFASRQYLTNFITSLSVTFPKRQKAYIFQWGQEHELSPEECFYVLCAVNGWDGIQKLSWVMDEEVSRFVKQQRDLLGIADRECITKTWLKKHPNGVAQCQRRMLSFFQERGRKGYTIAPIMSIRNHFLTIDTKVLYGMMKEAKLVQCNEAVFRSIAQDHFHSVFAVKRFLSKTNTDKKFGCLVETDGVSVCFHFHSPKPYEVQSNRVIKGDEGRRVIAIDPGRSNLMYGVELLTDGTKRIYQLTKRQYYADSHFTQNKRRNERWNKEIEGLLEDLSKTSPRTTQVSVMEEHLRVLLRVAPYLWSHYTKHRCALVRMDNYIHKRKTLDRFFASMQSKGEEKPVIAYGAAKFNPTAKNELSSPTSALSKRCAEHYPIVFVDEFRTTKCCHGCGCELKGVKRNGYEVRGLRCCSSSNCLKTRLVSRDLNAALNILACYRAGTNRPKHLCRKHSSPVEG